MDHLNGNSINHIECRLAIRRSLEIAAHARRCAQYLRIRRTPSEYEFRTNPLDPAPLCYGKNNNFQDESGGSEICFLIMQINVLLYVYSTQSATFRASNM